MGRNTADVAIIGGGVHGCSIAYHLAKRGVKTVLFEKDYISSGSSGRSAAGLRYQFGTEVNCRLAKYNMEKIPHLQEELEYKADLEYDPAGYLWIAYSETQLEQLRKNVALQNSLGVDSVILDPVGIKEVAPGLNVEGMLGASFNQKDGHVNPHTMNFAYADAARRFGAEIHTKTTVTGLLTDNKKVWGVKTTKGDWEVGQVVCAANAWAAEVGKWCGLEIPIEPERHSLLITEPVERMKHPMTLCLDDGSYWKQCPNGTFMLGWGNKDEKKDTDYYSSWQFLEEVTQRVLAKMPCLAGVRCVRQWTGPYGITPDEQAIMGETPVENFLIDAGWSGHGLQFAPSAGRIISEIVMGEDPFLDISCFRYSRFEEGCLFPEPACI
ncbi:MAG: FAD-binding oxidoreductase [Thermovirgaceae bacterium]|nr:FAD-binding oxidoreductase [Synergistales bacterium]MDI9392385.1 FAD-binding oxidoreductase [Synergistota bacterium]MDY0178772.1 FAD-binding oxidoreductase [Synergistaceae bacterium]HRW87170.1 FAD-binding oxidoreductase [Thermovirgaceae bacterium]MDD3133765.1 FAD-binding oxidoreductase [Synergistales bacterium]